MLRSRRKYAGFTAVLLFAETAIALYHFHPLIRGFLGDVLAVMLLFTFLKTFFSLSSIQLATGALAFAILIETAQLFEMHRLFDIRSEFLQLLTGTTFDPMDILAYLVGYGFILLLEYRDRYRTLRIKIVKKVNATLFK